MQPDVTEIVAHGCFNGIVINTEHLQTSQPTSRRSFIVELSSSSPSRISVAGGSQLTIEPINHCRYYSVVYRRAKGEYRTVVVPMA
jgi:hypothetical protein